MPHRVLAPLAAYLLLASCMTTEDGLSDRELARAHLVPVTGSRIQRRVDRDGHVVSAAMMQVIDETQLSLAPGVTLADKLAGR